jgi:hypothetical protein
MFLSSEFIRFTWDIRYRPWFLPNIDVPKGKYKAGANGHGTLRRRHSLQCPSPEPAANQETV